MEAKGTETSPVGPADSADLLATLWAMPITYARMWHDFQIDGMHAWARMLWSHDRHHGHEPPSQLEIPDAIADSLEQDLFA